MSKQFTEFYKGISTSKYDYDGFDDLDNIDIHTELGTARSQLALEKESGTNIDEAVVMALAPSGTVYMFSKTSGKIWKRTTSGAYSTVTANTHTAGHKGAMYFNGYIYYTTNADLGRFTPDGEGSRNDSFGAYSNDASLKPMVEHSNSLSLYIGDGKYVASVDSSGSFSANVLDLPPQYKTSSMVGYGDDLIVGGFVNAYVNSSKVFRWDTYSSSFYRPDDVDDIGVNMFIPSNNSNILFAQSGTDGNIYSYDGNSLNFYKQKRDVTTTRNSYNNTTLKGIPYFAIGGKVYSIQKKRRGLDFAISGEFTCSAGSSATIKSILAVGTQLLVAWSNAGTYGVDKISTDRANGVITTPVVISTKTRSVEVKYSSLPTGTTIGIETNIDNAGFTSQDTEVDSLRQIVTLQNDVGNVNSIQARVTLNSSGSSTPIIEKINIV